MSGSNEGWMASAGGDRDVFALMDQGKPLPEPGEHAVLDAWLASKYITRRALARTGARLSVDDDGVLIWGQPGGMKMRRLPPVPRGGKEHWPSLGAHWDVPHVMDPRDRDAPLHDTLLIPGGQTDSARMWELYPRCHVAVLLHGETYVPAQLPQIAAAYKRVFVCTDADEAGDKFAHKLMAAIPGAVRFRPPESVGDNDWCAIGLEDPTPPFPAPPTLPLLDIAALASEPPPPLVVDHTIPEGCVIWIGGHPGEGKSTYAMYCALQFIRSGRPVLWLDWEGGPRQSAARFSDLGAAPAEISKLRYVDAPHITADPGGRTLLLSTVESLGAGALVVFDSCSKALAIDGLDENSNAETTRWTMHCVQPLRERATVIVLDHVAKEATRATPYPRGAGAKKADTDVEFYLEAAAPFNRETVGKLRLTRHKDRIGIVPHTIWYSIGDGKGGIPLVETMVVRDDQSGVETTAKILAHLKSNEDRGLTISQLETILQDKSGAVARILVGLSEDISSGVIAEATTSSWTFKMRGGPALDTDAF